jgi:urate oxidase
VFRKINHWLQVLKSTGSAFTGFYRDEYTTLVEVDDRIFSTSIDLSYAFSDITISAPTDEKKFEFIVPLQKGEAGYDGSVWDEEVPSRARIATLETFALDGSASVQVYFFVVPHILRSLNRNAGHTV